MVVRTIMIHHNHDTLFYRLYIYPSLGVSVFTLLFTVTCNSLDITKANILFGC